jgi:hypothetical protein
MLIPSTTAELPCEARRTSRPRHLLIRNSMTKDITLTNAKNNAKAKPYGKNDNSRNQQKYETAARHTPTTAVFQLNPLAMTSMTAPAPVLQALEITTEKYCDDLKNLKVKEAEGRGLEYQNGNRARLSLVLVS